MRSVRELEDRFNRKFGYPWVFLNEEDFDDNFKRCVESLTPEACSAGGRVSSRVYYRHVQLRGHRLELPATR